MRVRVWFSVSVVSFSLSLSPSLSASLWTSDQARGPAEFKHITKRRKRN